MAAGARKRKDRQSKLHTENNTKTEKNMKKKSDKGKQGKEREREIQRQTDLRWKEKATKIYNLIYAIWCT